MDDFATLISVRASEPEYHPRPFLWGLIFAVMILLGIAVSIFGPGAPTEVIASSTPTPDREARNYSVVYRFGIFSPTNLRVHVGDTVQFHNETSVAIRIVADLRPGSKTPQFDSVGLISPDTYFSYTFATAGVFGYHIEADPNQAGVIIVR